MARLQAAGVRVWLFGGWAEELLGLRRPSEHRDIDLLYPAADFALADAFMAADGRVTEITAKRFPHKRAFLSDDIMVELILAQPASSGGYFTCFWGDTPGTGGPLTSWALRPAGSGLRVPHPCEAIARAIAGLPGRRAAWQVLRRPARTAGKQVYLAHTADQAAFRRWHGP